MSSGFLIPPARQQFLDQNGQPVSGGSVYFYVPGTTTPAPTWADPSLSVLNPNPIQLDAAGECIAWGNTQYRQVVLDQNGQLIWDGIAGLQPSFWQGSGNLASPGWWTFPGGLMLQWHFLVLPTQIMDSVQNFPTPFPNASFISMATLTHGLDPTAITYSVGVSVLSKTQFEVTVSSTIVGGSATIYFLHLGF